MSIGLHPHGDRILVLPLEAETTSKGGIVIPDQAKEKPARGKVVAVGSGKVLKDGSHQAIAVKEGTVVVYGKYSGTEIKHEGTDYLIMKEEDILATEV
jgi:chaperonin GroES